MKHLFYPDDYKPDFSCYDAAYLQKRGIRHLTCDIDNTLVTYDDPEPTEAVLAWLARLREAGISVAFLSNNTEERVRIFNASLGYYTEADAHKPMTGAIKRFLSETGYKKKETAHLGDQIFTDVIMANACGITSLLLPPIKDKKTFFFRFKRMLEKPILACYLKRSQKQNAT